VLFSVIFCAFCDQPISGIDSVIDNEINTDEFFTEETPLNQVRFKKILPWLVREPRLVGA